MSHEIINKSKNQFESIQTTFICSIYDLQIKKIKIFNKTADYICEKKRSFLTVAIFDSHCYSSKMAKPFSVSDLVLFRGNMCIVNSISHQMGYAQFTLTNLDTSYQQRAFRYEISDVETVVIDQLMREDFDNMPEAEVSQEPASRRFAPVTEDELVELEEKRTSKNTHAQTAWGVNIFRGKHDHVCLFCLHLEHGDLNVGHGVSNAILCAVLRCREVPFKNTVCTP